MTITDVIKPIHVIKSKGKIRAKYLGKYEGWGAECTK